MHVVINNQEIPLVNQLPNQTQPPLESPVEVSNVPTVQISKHELPDPLDFPEQYIEEVIKLREEALDLFAGVLRNDSLPQYLEKKRRESGTPDAAVAIKINTPENEQPYSLILGTYINRLQQETHIDSDGVVVVSSKFERPDLPPGLSYWMGINNEPNEPTPILMHMTPNGKDGSFTYGDRLRELPRAVEGLIAAKSHFVQPPQPQG